MSADRARVVLLAAILALAWALVVWISGGVEWHLGGVVIRARGIARPLEIAGVLLIAYALLRGRALAGELRLLPQPAPRLIPLVVFALALVTAADAFTYGVFVAGGSDSYGYVSEAYGWKSGSLPKAYPLALSLPFGGDPVQIPLGYSPGHVPHTMVPSYAPGLPLLMALGIALAGSIGPYLVDPIASGLFVWFTFVLGRRVCGASWGLACAIVAATSPIVLYMSLWPMSDVPAGTAWTAAVVAILGTRPRDAALAGLCTGIGLLIRPNLLPLTLVPFAYIVLTTSGRERFVRAGLFATCLAPAVIAIGIINALWYGSPLTSGYGSPRVLYSLHNIVPNLRRYPVWLWQSQSSWIVVPLVASAFRRKMLLLWAFFLITLACYVAYFPFDPWWYLRFLLPGLGALFVLIVAGARAIGERVTSRWGAAVASLLVAVVVIHSVRFTADQAMFGSLRDSEHRHIDVAEFIRDRLPANGIFFAMQHSGSIRFYAGRYTLRYDLLPHEWARRAPAELERMDFHPYLVVDDGERALVERAFSLDSNSALPWPYVARMRESGGVSILDLAAHPSGEAPVPIEPRATPRYLPPRSVTSP
jgi:hypothetical protein